MAPTLFSSSSLRFIGSSFGHISVRGSCRAFSGPRVTETKAAWNASAIVASQSPVLEADLEDAIATQPKLLDEDGVLAWFVSRPSTSADLVADARSRGLVANSNARNLAAHLLADPEQVGLDRELLRPRLEAGLGRSSPWGRPALQTLVALFPDDVRVHRRVETVLAVHL